MFSVCSLIGEQYRAVAQAVPHMGAYSLRVIEMLYQYGTDAKVKSGQKIQIKEESSCT